MSTTRLEFQVVFNEDNPDVSITVIANFIEASMNKMQWKTPEEEVNLLRRIVEVELSGVFTVINENKVKADFSDKDWIPPFY